MARRQSAGIFLCSVFVVAYVMLCSFRFADSGSISMASNRICHFKLVLLGDSAG